MTGRTTTKTTYVWREGQLVEKPPEAPRGPGITIIPDHTEYLSPLGTGAITSRAARREDLKRGHCREVDPGEFKPSYINSRFAQKRGLPTES